MHILFVSPPGIINVGSWRNTLAQIAPDICIVEPHESDAELAEAAMVQFPQPGFLRRYPKLRVIFSLGAGVEHLWADPELPNVPIVKMASPMKARCMSEFILYAVLRHHRGFDVHERNQLEHRWDRGPLYTPLAAERRVMVLGLGELGMHAAITLRDYGFAVSAWSRSLKSVVGVACYAGQAGLDSVLPQTDILVSVLPHTHTTEGLLNAELFAKLPRGAAVVNVGRGKLLVAKDLIAAIERDHLSGATLDVHDPEPLPADSVLWHPRVFNTPHVASYPPPETAAPSLVENIRRLQRGEPLLRLVDREAGY